jgi:AbrB family looped-hinge helix DNA binding protein
MAAETTVSSKFQVVIPKAIRDRVALEPGTRLAVILKGRVISLVPELPLADLRGLARGARTADLREEADRL